MAAMVGRAGRTRLVAVGTAIAIVLGACAPADPAGRRADTGALVALDVRSGRVVWEEWSDTHRFLAIAGTGKDVVLAEDSRCTERAQPHRLVALDAASGDRRWDRAGAPGVAARTMHWSASPSVDVAARGVIIVPGGRGGEPSGLSADTGRPLWTLRGEFFLGVSARSVFTAGPGGPAGVLVAHDRRTGRRAWSFPASPAPPWSETFDVVGADRDHVVVANGNYLMRFNDQPGSATTFYVLDARTGRQLATFTSPDPTFTFADVVMTHDTLVYGERHDVVARDLLTGATRWTRAFPNAVGSANATGVYPRATAGPDELLVEVTGAGTQHVVALDSSTGATAWEMSPGYVAAGGPRVSVVGQPHSQVLVGVSTVTGKERWRFDPNVVGGQYTTIKTQRAGRRVAVGQICDTG